MIVLLLGPPGCGKGTQGAFIAASQSIPAISTGEIFRAECKAGTALGREACAILARGDLVDDEIVNQMVVHRISQPDCRAGFLLDGYPRTLVQAEFLDRLLRAKNLSAPTVIHLQVPAATLVRRLSLRRQCPVCSTIYNLGSQPPRREGTCDQDGAELIRRPDDTEAVIGPRLKAYAELIGPVVDHYRGAGYHVVDGGRSPEDVQQAITRLLSQGRRRLTRAQRAPAAVGAL